jgi:hypothetical protein
MGQRNFQQQLRHIRNKFVFSLPPTVQLPTVFTIHCLRASAVSVRQLCFLFLLDFLLRPFSGTRRSICQAYASNDVVCDKKVLLGVSSMKKFSGESTPSHEFSEGILHANRKSRITFDRLEKDAKFQSRSIPNRGQGIDW